jgi:hypothetical protein
MGLLDTILTALGLKKPEPEASEYSPPPPARPASNQDADEPERVEEEEEEEEDDGEGRDYALEARDDRASFDFDNAIEGYFEAQFRIEQAWEDEPKRAQLFGKYGIRNVQHWYQVKATFERWSESPAARRKYATPGDLMQVQMNVTQKVAMDVMGFGNQQAALGAELDPVEGVSLEQWAKAQAKIASGADYAPLIAALGIDKAKWDRVSAEWNARMSRDTSFTITMEYSKHFQSAGAGQFAAAAAASASGQVGTEAEAPITLERYVEIEIAQSTGVAQGRDAATILKSFGMSPMEWGQVGGWWSVFISQNAMKNNGELHQRYTRLQAQYEAKYKTASADDDISF